MSPRDVRKQCSHTVFGSQVCGPTEPETEAAECTGFPPLNSTLNYFYNYARFEAGSNPLRELTMTLTPEELRSLSAQELERLGLAGIAYLKPLVRGEYIGWAIYNADGTEEYAFMPSRDVARAACRMHDIEPHDVH